MVHEQDYPFLVDSVVLVSESSLCVMFSYIHLEKKKTMLSNFDSNIEI